MKKLCWLLAIVMMFSCVSISFAEEANTHDIKRVTATDTQVALSTMSKDIIEVDGLKFRDLNSNGSLDVYEDWRKSSDERTADLISQMTLEEEVGLLFQVMPNGQIDNFKFDDKFLYEENNPFAAEEGGAEQYYSVSYFVNGFNINSFLDNSNGTVSEMVDRHNDLQMMTENTRLGVPATIVTDRMYDAWAGYTDDADNAYGVSENAELITQLWSHYGEAMASVGFHVALQPTSAQLTSANGEDPARVAEKTALQIAAYQSSGKISTCAKHYIFGAYGGSMGAGRDTDVYENQAYTWQAAVNAGTGWIMDNYGMGLSGDCLVDYDAETVRLLREDMGYNGVIITDCWTLGMDGTLVGNVTDDGFDLGTATLVDCYRILLENGVDMFMSRNVEDGVVYEEDAQLRNYPEAIIEGVNTGAIDKALVDRAATRVLKDKFDKGQFEDPFSDLQYALEMNCSAEYIASPWEITDTATLNAARRADIVALEKQLAGETAILIKNDNDLLPLSNDQKIYFYANNSNNAAFYGAELGARAQIVDDIALADVVVADLTGIDDAAELIVDDAKEAGKPIVLVTNCTAPNEWAVNSADALLYMVYSCSPDHGTAEAGYLFYTQADVYADLLFGQAQPMGELTMEIARKDTDEDWVDLASDVGVSTYVRLLMLGMMQDSDTYSVPNNFSEALLTSEYGMSYGGKPAFRYQQLVLPKSIEEVTTESNGSASTSTQEVIKATVGVPFKVSCLLWNDGDDGVTTVQVLDGETLIAEKTMAVCGGSWRVVEIEVTIDTAGEHVITVGDLTGVITIAE